MAKTNTKTKAVPVYTHEGAKTKADTPLAELNRAVKSCFLWEDTFYENGVDIAKRIRDLAHKCAPGDVAALAVTCRKVYRIRHASLWLVLALVDHPKRVPTLLRLTLPHVIDRADELSEIVAMYWNNGKKPLPNQLKRGIADAFLKFDAYQIAKYNGDKDIKLRDVMFLTHPKPKTVEQARIFEELANNRLESPDTWEVNLSAGADKKETFTRLLQDNKLGYMALLRNLRNMEQAGVDHRLVSEALVNGAAKSKALPFRFISAWKHSNLFKTEIDIAMRKAASARPVLPGTTVILVDKSGSMLRTVSGRSEMHYWEAAASLAVLARESAQDCFTYVFGDSCVKVPDARGMTLYHNIEKAHAGHGTDIRGAIAKAVRDIGHIDRVIIVTDMQSSTAVGGKLPSNVGKGYFLNVAAYKNGVAHGEWEEIDGFSEATIDYIREIEG